MARKENTDTLFRLVNDIHLAFARLFNHQAVELGLTRAHWRVIGGLYRHDGLTQTELASDIAMARSPLGKILDRLEDSGLLERYNDPDDRRVHRLRLTEKAETLIRPARDLTESLEQRAIVGLSPASQQELLDSLLTIRKSLFEQLEQEDVTSEFHY